jgi:hypothetical protein
MTFSWISVWVSFITAPVLGRRFALLDALLSFTLAAVIAAGSKARRLPNYKMAGLHLIGLTTLLALSLYHSFFSAGDFFSSVWLDALTAKMGELKGFLTVLLVVCCTFVFWMAGVKLGRKPLNYMLVCNRFDVGLTSLFALLLIQLVLVTRGGVTTAAPPDMFFLYSFLLCGLTAIGLARHHSAADKEFLPGIRGIATLLIIVSGMLMAAGLVAIAAPTILTPVAEEGYEVVKTAARPLGAMITRFLIFVFRRDLDYKAGMGGLEANPGNLHPQGTGPSDFWLARLMSEGLIGLLFIGLLVIAGVALWQLIQWMLRREELSVESPKQANRLFGLLFRFCAWLRFRWEAFIMRLGGPVQIGQLFISLQSWGRFGGVSRRRWETPGEYAGRLCARFPQTAEDINTIVTAYQQRFYGENALNKDCITASDAAWRRLKSPKLWTLRWQALLGRPQTP